MRSKWRFEIKRFINHLLALSPLDEYYQEAADYLYQIYNMLWL